MTGEPDGEDDPPYCAACVHAAVQWSAEAGMAPCPPGVGALDLKHFVEAGRDLDHILCRVIDGENTQQWHVSQYGNGQLAEIEQHVTHLLPAERELLAECHRGQVYLAMCGEELPVSELQSSYCEPGCERMVTYCQKCLEGAARCNAEAGLSDLGRR